MAEASTPSVGKASVANDDEKSQPVASTSRDPSLSRYLQAVEAEKQEWKDYATSLRKKYHTLNMEVNSVPTIHYLPDEAKDFLMEIQKTLEKRIYKRSALAEHKEKKHKEIILLMKELIENQTELDLSILNSLLP